MKTCISLVILIFATGCAGGIQRYAHPVKDVDVRPVWLGAPNLTPSIDPGHTGGETMVSTPWSYRYHRDAQDVVGTITVPIGLIQVSEGYKFTTPEVDVKAEWQWWFNANYPIYPDPKYQIQPGVVRGP